MTTQRFIQCPSPSCTCDSCITEYVKDYEDGEPIYYSDEYTGPFESNGYSRYDW